MLVCAPPLLAMDVTLAIRLVATLSNSLSRSGTRQLKGEILKSRRQDVVLVRANRYLLVQKVADSARLNGNARHASRVRSALDVKFSLLLPDKTIIFVLLIFCCNYSQGLLR